VYILPPDDPGHGAGAEPAQDPVTRWALAARDGDAAAESAFVRATQAEVWRFVAALVEPRHADDLTQETFLRAFRALPQFEARASARTWLLAIARRTCADHIRVAQRLRRLDARLSAQAAAAKDAGADTATDPAADPAADAVARDLLDRLPADRRSAFVLTQVLGLSYAEAAEAEEVPVGTIRSRVARARDQLIRALVAETVG
jgi:RNA polymerase sigma-70 factor (ECF subfamily)